MISIKKRKKLLFISMISCISLLVSLILILLWFIPYIGSGIAYQTVKWTSGALVLSVISFIVWACSSLLIKTLYGRNVPFFKQIWGITIKFLLPLIMIIRRLFGISKKKIRQSFIAVNNELVDFEKKTYAPDEILLLTPMCLQSSKCNRRLVFDLNQCKRCGKCPVTGLLDLSDKYGIYLAIATGGTIARRIVYERRPKLIIACACERDLTSGIQDTYPISVYGILNSRPNGPCIDTDISMEDLEKAICRFLSKQKVF
jgi:uncharacterized protein